MSKFSIRKRIMSFRFAFNGIFLLIRSEHNAWIHLLATVVVIGLGVLVKLSRPEWMLIIFAIALVFVAEAFNTAVEHLANAITRESNNSIKNAKDIAAGAVLIAAIMAAAIGLFIFIPYLIDLF